MTTQNQLSTFNFHNSPIRTITDPKGEIWFCGTDVCNILGYQNSRKALQDHCKEAGVTKRYTPTTSGNQEITFINEPNLYRLIIKSRKPEAERVEAWVFEEVLPQIRKTGSYSQNTHEIRPLEITLKVQMLDNLYYMAKNASELCHQYRKMMNDIINTLNIEYFRPSKPDYKYQLVSEMQFALDDVEVILKTHTREQTAKNIELARLRRSF